MFHEKKLRIKEKKNKEEIKNYNASRNKKRILYKEYQMNIIAITYQFEIKVIEIKQFKNLAWKKKNSKRSNNKFKHNLQINCEYFQNYFYMCILCCFLFDCYV